MPVRFHEIEGVFRPDPDGPNFCDIYVDGVTREHWCRFLNLMRGMAYSFSLSGEAATIPDDPTEVLHFDYDRPGVQTPGLMIHLPGLEVRVNAFLISAGRSMVGNPP